MHPWKTPYLIANLASDQDIQQKQTFSTSQIAGLLILIKAHSILWPEKGVWHQNQKLLPKMLKSYIIKDTENSDFKINPILEFLKDHPWTHNSSLSA